jgi:hypothetical protein
MNNKKGQAPLEITRSPVLKHKSLTGQAVLEMAIFGSLILFIFGVLISQLQRLNDQQYVQMEAFRRALYQACRNNTGGSGAGSSVQYSLIQNRRYADTSNNFRKGATQILSAGASLSWAVPEIKKDTEAAHLIIVNVNGDEKIFSYRDYISKDNDRYDKDGNERTTHKVFTIGNTNFWSNLYFQETSKKKETPTQITIDNKLIKKAKITTDRWSKVEDAATTQVQYDILEKSKVVQPDGTVAESEVLLKTGDLYNNPQIFTSEHSSVWETEF